jgi:hypothetical protein
MDENEESASAFQKERPQRMSHVNLAHAEPGASANPKAMTRSADCHHAVTTDSKPPLWRERRSALEDSSSTATDSTTSTTASSIPDLGSLQEMIGTAVRSLVQGQLIQVVPQGKDTCAVPCIIRVDRELKKLTLQRGNKKDGPRRCIRLKDIREVCVGATLELDGIKVDETSVSLVLESDLALVMRFEEQHEREHFASCLALLVDGRQKQRAGTPRASGLGLDNADPSN